MVKFLEPKYAVYLVVASLIAIVLLQVTGEGQALQADAPLLRLEVDVHDRRERLPTAEPIAGHPVRWGERTLWR